jgi:hypothetical protein
MEYGWIDDAENVADFTLDFERPLAVGDVFVDLCTGRRYRVSFLKEQPRVAVHTSLAGLCSEDELSRLRKQRGYIFDVDCKSRCDFVIEATGTAQV